MTTIITQRLSPAVDTLLKDADPVRLPLLQALRELLLGVDPRVREDVKWKAPSYFLQCCFATLNQRVREGVLIVLHCDASGRRQQRPLIDDPQALLEWKSADRALLAVSDLQQLDQHAVAIGRILEQWIAALPD